MAELRNNITDVLDNNSLAAEEKLNLFGTYQARFNKLKKDTGVLSSSVPAIEVKEKPAAPIVPAAPPIVPAGAPNVPVAAAIDPGAAAIDPGAAPANAVEEKEAAAIAVRNGGSSDV